MGVNSPVNSNVLGVETYINTAYDKIKNVSDNLDALLNLNEAFVNLEGIYLGQLSSAPIQRPDTTPLKNGDHYLNTSANSIYFYLEGNWINYKIFYTQDALNTAVGQGPFNIWVAYADDVLGNGISVNPTGKDYIGFVNSRTSSQVNITDSGIYTWSKYVGNNAYVHVAYADSSNGVDNFNSASGSYIGIYTDNTVADSTEPTDYTWNLIKGSDGIDGSHGTNVTVVDLGGGRKAIIGANGTVYLDDGEVPTLTDNGDGTYTITSGLESIIVSNGETPLFGIDYFDGDKGEYISFVFAQVAKGDPVPTIDDDSGTFDGVNEVFPSGATWTDEPLFTEGNTTYISKNRYVNSAVTNTWTLKNSSWSVPTIFMDTLNTVPQIQIKGFAFKRSSVVITTAPSGGSYLDPIPNGWSDGIPAGSLPIYVTSVIFTSDGLAPQPPGTPVTWNVPELLAESGQGFKHRFSTSINGPWSDTPSINSLYMITSVRGSDGIWVDDTANPILIKGETGAIEQAQLKAFTFKRSSDPAFLETPSGGSFLSPNPVAGAVVGWSDGIPAGTETIYVSTRVFTTDGLTPQQVSWSQSQVFAYNGESFRMLFSIDGSTNWHVEPAPADQYMQAQTSIDSGVTWINSGDPIKIKGENGAAGVAGIDGADGPSGRTVASLNVYLRAASPPSTPTGGQFDYDTLVLTPPTTPVTWSITIPVGQDTLYVSRAVSSIIGASGIDTTITWGAPDVWESNSVDGDSIYQVSVYQRASSTPSTPAANSASYDFGANSLTPPSGWFQSPPAGTDPLYVTTTSFSINGNTGTDSTQTWSTPVIIMRDGIDGSQGLQGLQGDDGTQGIQGDDGNTGNTGSDGTDGVNNYFHIAYADSITGTGFSQSPTGKAYIGTYVDTIVSDAGSGSGLWDWQLVLGSQGPSGDQGIQGTDGSDGTNSYLHIAYATNASGGGFDVSVSTGKTYIGQYTDSNISDSNDWEDYSWSLIKGDTGTAGISTFQWSLYARWSINPGAPTTASFNFTTNTGSPPGGWYNSPPADNGFPLWVTTGLASIVGDTGTDSSITFSTPTIMVIPPVSGAPGVNGSLHYYGTASVWTDNAANLVISNAGNTKIEWDVVTLSNGTDFAETQYWDGNSWEDPGLVVDGNLIVLGTIAGNRLVTGAVDTDQLNALSINAGKIQTDAIIAGKIAALAVDTRELKAEAVTAAKIEALTITAAQIKAGTITAEKIFSKTITAEQLAVGAITAEKLSIDSQGNESGNASLVKMILDPFSNTPINIRRTSDDVSVFSINIESGLPKARIDGSAGDGFIQNLSAIDDAVITAINPYYNGAEHSIGPTLGTLANFGTAALIITTENKPKVNITFSLNASDNYIGLTNQNWTAPVWLVEIFRGYASDDRIFNKIYTGSASNIQDPEPGVDFWECNYNINISGGVVDTSSLIPQGSSQRYTIKITRSSGTPTSLYLSNYFISLGGFITSTLGSQEFHDKDTGFAIKTGFYFVAANTFYRKYWTNSFAQIWSVNLTANNANSLPYVPGVNLGYIDIQNQSNSSQYIYYNATGWIAP